MTWKDNVGSQGPYSEGGMWYVFGTATFHLSVFATAILSASKSSKIGQTLKSMFIEYTPPTPASHYNYAMHVTMIIPYNNACCAFNKQE